MWSIILERSGKKCTSTDREWLKGKKHVKFSNEEINDISSKVLKKRKQNKNKNKNKNKNENENKNENKNKQISPNKD